MASVGLGAQGGNRESMSVGIKGKSNVRTRKGENVCQKRVCVPGRDGVGKRNEVLRDRIRNRLSRAVELLLPVRRRHKDVSDFIYGDPTPSSIIRQLVSIEPQEVPHLSAAGAGNGDEWLFLTRPFNTLNQAHYKAQVSANGPPWAFLIKTSEETHLNAAPRLLCDAAR